MDVSKWELHKIMQLPRCAFGQIYLISASIYIANNDTAWDISEIAFPKVAVIWQLSILWQYANTTDCKCRLALGTKIPTTIAEMNEYEELINGLGTGPTKPRNIYGFTSNAQEMYPMKKLIEPQGKKLVLEVHAPSDKETRVRAAVAVSSIPREVPDWLLSGPGGYR